MEDDDSQAVIVPYSKLADDSQDISKEIELAFGCKGTGYLLVSNIPNKFIQQRILLMPLIQKMANMNATEFQKYSADKDLYNSRGLSKVSIKHSEGITEKCSLYFTCPDSRAQINEQIKENRKKSIHGPFNNQQGQKALKLFTEKNIWVSDIKFPAINITNNMLNVGELLAKKIDTYMRGLKVTSYPANCLQDIVRNGTTHMGRLIYYYPTDISTDEEKDWCHRHTDYCALTALTTALYIDENGKPSSIPTETGGLYMVSRDSKPKQVKATGDMLCFHIGQSFRILSGGHLTSTPHSVGIPEQLKGKGIGRATVALFMQPNPYYPMKVPEGIDTKEIEEPSNSQVRGLKGRWQNGMPFGKFLHNSFQSRSTYI